MAEAAVSMVLKKLGEMATEEVNLHLNAEGEVRKLSEKLKTIQMVLADADQKGLTDLKVRSWLAKLQDIAYDIDDVLDEWTYELLKQQFEEEGEEEVEDPNGHHPWEMVISLLQSVCLCFNRVVRRRNIAVIVKELNGKLDLVAKENEDDFKFVPNVTPFTHEFKRIDSTSQVDSSKVQGREKELKDIENKLLGDSGSSTINGTSEWGNSKSSIRVISVVGSGGMGKTTLAQLAFHQVKHQFKEIVWVCVSDPFDEIKIAKSILEALNKSSTNLTQLDVLLRCIESSIKDKRFLVVLDDVWLENEERWNPFWISLKSNAAPGSRILVTTRSTKVAKAMGSSRTDILELGPLSDSYCWSILSRLAFHERNPTDCQMLENIGRLIARKCKGLPLAAKLMGSHLSSTNSLEEWENVLLGEVWELEKMNRDLFPILKLSYRKLDPSSKRCFSYCAMFPKDYKFDSNLLKGLWMAQGFVPGRNVSEVEINAQKIFDDLAARSFFQDFERDGINGTTYSCKMHDMVHDFAIFLTNKDCLTLELEDEKIPTKPYSLRNARHVMIESKRSTPSSINHAETIHTFVLKGSSMPPENLFNILKRPRALILSDSAEVIPEEVGNMIHLRFLQLKSRISELPGTICNLFQLQNLEISECYFLNRFPQGIHKLQNLRHLVISQYLELPQGLETLSNLRTLYTFSANKHCNNNKLGYLKNLDQLRTLAIMIQGLNEVDDVHEAERANLKNKKLLEYFFLRLDISDERISRDVLEALQPHTKLSKLWLLRIPKIPDWMITLTNLRQLRLHEPFIVDWSHLAKLPALEKLIVYNMRNLKKIGHDFMGIEMACHVAPIFPRLKELKFSKQWEWKEWEDITAELEESNDVSIFPCLESLEMIYCSALKGLPHCLLRKASNLKFLHIENCKYLERRYNPDNGEDWNKVSHIPKVQFVYWAN